MIYDSKTCSRYFLFLAKFNPVKSTGLPPPHVKYLEAQEESGSLLLKTTSPSQPITSPGGTTWTHRTWASHFQGGRSLWTIRLALLTFSHEDHGQIWRLSNLFFWFSGCRCKHIRGNLLCFWVHHSGGSFSSIWGEFCNGSNREVETLKSNQACALINHPNPGGTLSTQPASLWPLPLEPWFLLAAPSMGEDKSPTRASSWLFVKPWRDVTKKQPNNLKNIS